MREREILKALQWSGFHASSNDQLLPIRQLELFKEKGNIESNSNINDAEKQVRIQDIDDKLAALNSRMEELSRIEQQ